MFHFWVSHSHNSSSRTKSFLGPCQFSLSIRNRFRIKVNPPIHVQEIRFQLNVGLNKWPIFDGLHNTGFFSINGPFPGGIIFNSNYHPFMLDYMLWNNITVLCIYGKNVKKITRGHLAHFSWMLAKKGKKKPSYGLASSTREITQNKKIN